MFTELRRKRTSGWTLVEMMVGLAVFSMAGLALGTLFLFSIRSFASLSNYSELEVQNRRAMDVLTREVRQARGVTSYSTNPPSLSLLSGDGWAVTYSFDSATKRMLRTVNGSSEVLLTNCNLLQFQLYQRNPSNANFGVFPIATGNWSNSVKVVELSWKTSKALNPTTRINSENVQTARIVIRKAND